MENEEYNCLREIREAKKLSRFEASALIERVSGTDCSPQKVQRLEAKSEEDIHPKEIMLISESYSCPKLKYYYCNNVCPLGVTMPQVSARDFVTVSTLKANSNGKYLWSENNGKVAPGDVVFFHSTSDKSSGQYKHVVMVSADKDGGTIKYYAHNEARDGHKNLYAEKGKEMVVIHFKTSYLEYCKEYNTHGHILTTARGELKTYPCSVNTFAKSKSAFTLEKGTALEAIGLVRNDQGNLWYKVLYKGKTLYWYAGDASWTAWESIDVTISNCTLPKGTIQAGKDFNLKGTISAKYNMIGSVTGEVYAGSAMKGKAKISGIDSGLKKQKYELKNSKVDKLLKFNEINSCGKFTFVIKATCEYSYAVDGQRMVSKCEQCIVKTSTFNIG